MPIKTQSHPVSVFTLKMESKVAYKVESQGKPEEH